MKNIYCLVSQLNKDYANVYDSSCSKQINEKLMMRFISILFLLICAGCPAVAQSLMNVIQLANAPGYKDVRIALPADCPSDAKYNTIYVLDADYMFDLVADMAGYLQYNEIIPPTAVVAVDYTQPEKRRAVLRIYQ